MPTKGKRLFILSELPYLICVVEFLIVIYVVLRCSFILCAPWMLQAGEDVGDADGRYCLILSHRCWELANK